MCLSTLTIRPDQGRADKAALKELFAELEFRTIAKKVLGEALGLLQLQNRQVQVMARWTCFCRWRG